MGRCVNAQMSKRGNGGKAGRGPVFGRKMGQGWRGDRKGGHKSKIF